MRTSLGAESGLWAVSFRCRLWEPAEGKGEGRGDLAGESGLMAGAQGGSSLMGLSCSLPQLK